MLAAVAVWAAHFGVVYGITGIVCPRNLAPAAPWAIGAATVLAAAAALALIVPAVRGNRPYGAAGWIGVIAACVALAAVLWQASPLLWEFDCP